MTVNDIREKKFDTSKRGYQPEEVDSFLQEICAYIQTLQRGNDESTKKLELLSSKVEEYKGDEESIQEALLGAQKLGKKVLSEAKNKADTMVNESQEKADETISLARNEAEKLLADAKSVAQELLVKSKAESKRMIADAQENVDTIIRNTKYDIEKEQNNLVRIQKEVSAFKASLLDLYRGHIDLIKNLPEVEYEESTREARKLDRSMYEQKPAEVPEITVEDSPEEVAEQNTEETVEFKTPEADQGREYTEDEKKLIEKAEKDVLQDTVEIAREHYVKKFSDLQFGGNAK